MLYSEPTKSTEFNQLLLNCTEETLVEFPLFVGNKKVE